MKNRSILKWYAWLLFLQFIAMLILSSLPPIFQNQGLPMIIDFMKITFGAVIGLLGAMTLGEN